MKSNMGSTDRVIRILVALAIGILYFTHLISGITALILGIVALALLLTGFISFCPLYRLIGISTKKNNK